MMAAAAPKSVVSRAGVELRLFNTHMTAPVMRISNAHTNRMMRTRLGHFDDFSCTCCIPMLHIPQLNMGLIDVIIALVHNWRKHGDRKGRVVAVAMLTASTP